VLACLCAAQAPNMSLGSVISAIPAFIPSATVTFSIHIPYQWVQLHNQLSESVDMVWGATNTTLANNVSSGTSTGWIRVDSDYPPGMLLPVNVTYLNGNSVGTFYAQSSFYFTNISLAPMETGHWTYGNYQLTLQRSIYTINATCYIPSGNKSNLTCYIDQLNAGVVPPAGLLYSGVVSMNTMDGVYLGSASSNGMTYPMDSFWISASSNETEVGSDSVIEVFGSFYSDKTYACHFLYMNDGTPGPDSYRANSSFAEVDSYASFYCQTPETSQSLLKSYNQIGIDYILEHKNGTTAIVYNSGLAVMPFKLTPPIDTNEDEWQWILGAVLGGVGIAIIVVILVLIVVRRRRHQNVEYQPMLRRA